MLEIAFGLEPREGEQDRALRAVRKLELLAAEIGVRFELKFDFIELKAFVAQYEAHRTRLAPNYDPAYCKLDLDRAFWVAGYDSHGQIVTTVAARLYDWRHTNLRSACEELSFYVDDPKLHCPADNFCLVPQPVARRITGWVQHSGCIWVFPAWTGVQSNGLRLSQILARLARSLGLLRWYPDWHISFSQTMLAEKGVAGSYGDFHGEPGASWNILGRRVLDGTLYWMSDDELGQDANLTVQGIYLRPLDQVFMRPSQAA